MKRVCIVNPGMRVGGVERKIADIAQHLSQNYPLNALRVDLILEQPASDNPNENIFLRRVQNSALNIHFKPTRGVPFFLYVLWRIWRSNPDIVLAFSRRPSVYALTIRKVLRRRKMRVVVGNDSIASHDLGLYVAQVWRRRILTAHMRWLYARGALFLAPSETSKQDLVEHFRVPPERIRVFKNWTLHAPLQIENKTIDLIYVGRVDRVKQIARLIEIARCVCARLPQLRVMIVGDGDELAEVQRRARELGLEGAIECVGFQADIGAYLARAKIFCLTSQFEGLPIAALEAMAFGLPVVTMDYAGARELVRAGETGFVCANEQEFCDAVFELLTSEARRAEMGQRARAFVQREHGAQVLDDYVACVLNEQANP